MNRLGLAVFVVASFMTPAFAQAQAQTPSTDSLIASLQKQIEQQAQRLERLEQRENMPAAILASAGPGVGLIVGEYIWTDPSGKRPLRYQGIDQAGEYVRDEKGNDIVTFEGNGPVVVREFQSTAFLVDSRHLLTSRFLLAPWRDDSLLDESETPALIPTIRMLHAFLPTVKHPLNVELTGTAESGEAVLCKLDETVKDQRGLELSDRSTLESGEPIVMVGYPGGVALLMSRVPDEVRREVYKYGEPGIDEMAGVLARFGYIQPIVLPSRVSGQTEDRIFFETVGNYGNTGGPVINARGEVVAMSESTHNAFPTFNMGISVAALKAWIAGAEQF